MRLSKLQKYILMKCYDRHGKIKNKEEFYGFYSMNGASDKTTAMQAALRKSLENLVNKDLVITYGHKTVKKWYINNVKLTDKGRKAARELLYNRQRKLPIK